jgi:hypothetical protein
LIAVSFLRIQFFDVFCLSIAWSGRWWPSACSSISWGLHFCKVTFLVLHATPTCQALAPGARRRIDFDQACVLQRSLRSIKLLHHIEVLAIFFGSAFHRNLVSWGCCGQVELFSNLVSPLQRLQQHWRSEPRHWCGQARSIYGRLQDLLVGGATIFFNVNPCAVFSNQTLLSAVDAAQCQEWQQFLSKAGTTASSQDLRRILSRLRHVEKLKSKINQI